MDHQPDWSNASNSVTLDLSTQSVGGLAKNDFELAGQIQNPQRMISAAVHVKSTPARGQGISDSTHPQF
jgi:hypothetical protein